VSDKVVCTSGGPFCNGPNFVAILGGPAVDFAAKAPDLIPADGGRLMVAVFLLDMPCVAVFAEASAVALETLVEGRVLEAGAAVTASPEVCEAAAAIGLIEKQGNQNNTCKTQTHETNEKTNMNIPNSAYC
jgi:hypothetical protein